jgi:hypothetical protein
MESQALIEIQMPEPEFTPELDGIKRSERIRVLMNKILDVFSEIAAEIWNDHLFNRELLPPCPSFEPGRTLGLSPHATTPLCMAARVRAIRARPIGYDNDSHWTPMRRGFRL